MRYEFWGKDKELDMKFYGLCDIYTIPYSLNILRENTFEVELHYLQCKLQICKQFQTIWKYFKAKVFADNPQNLEITKNFSLKIFRLYSTSGPHPINNMKKYTPNETSFPSTQASKNHKNSHAWEWRKAGNWVFTIVLINGCSLSIYSTGLHHIIFLEYSSILK